MPLPYSFKNLVLGSIDAFRAGDHIRAYSYVMDRQDKDDARYASSPESGHKGGFGAIQHGTIDGHMVTFAKGWGTKAGETLLADGHITAERFFAGEGKLSSHEHFGSGNGPHNNGTSRGKYTGPGK